MTFKRTDTGLVAKYLFYPDKVTIWVEGVTDTPIFEKLLRNKSCRLEAANGKQQCKKLADALMRYDYPYIVIMDGDYDILKRKRSPHRRIVCLYRYSIENYLFEEDVLEKVCLSYVMMAGKVDLRAGESLLKYKFNQLINFLEEQLMEIVILDIANEWTGTGKQVLPDKIENLLPEKGFIFDNEKIDNICSDKTIMVNTKEIEKAKLFVEKYLNKSRFVDLIRGHFIFGILRRLVFETIEARLGKKPNIDNKALTVLISSEVWGCGSYDHKNLKKRLYRAINNAVSHISNQ